MIKPKRFSEALGLWTGSMVAPIFAIGSALRQGRIFHPRGISFRADVKPAEDVDEKYMDLADGLAQGDALVRLAPAVWRGDKGLLPDVLGMAIRFNTDAADSFRAQDRTQDLLLITAKRLSTLPLAMLATNQRDFLDNKYHGAAPFEISGQPNMRLRLVPQVKADTTGPDRFAKLRKAVEEGDVRFRLDIESRRNESMSSPLIEIQLIEELVIDDDELEFWPFNVGQGIRPMGLVQFMRPVPYMLSQYARGI